MRLINDLSGLPDDLDANRDPLTGGLSGCVFGAAPGSRRLPRPLAPVDHAAPASGRAAST